MMPSKLLAVLATGACVAFTFDAAGCATKKYVRETVTPVDQRVGEVDKKVAANTTKIGEVDERAQSGISRAEEKAMTADNKAAQAAQAAAKASEQASQADRKAEDARAAAEKGLNRVGEMEKMVENIDSYREVSSDNVLFRFGRSDLTDEGKEKLDAITTKVGSMKHYIIEVEGYTDPTGPKDYNLGLSQRRADTVVRYLTAHNVPLRRIHMLGVGAVPRAEARTREARKESRKVEVKVLAPDLMASGKQPETTTNPTPTTTPR